MTGSLAGTRVAITRPEAGPLAALLADLGANVVHVPLIEVADPPDGGVALASALSRLPLFDWMVVTSPNGARRVGAAASAHPDLRLAAVGAATADLLAELAGRSVDFVPEAQRAAGLLGEFPTGPARVLLPQADRAGAELADGLVEHGFEVEVVHAYTTVGRAPTADERAALADLDAVVFASGSAVAAWLDAGDLGLPAVVVAIGPSTEQAARARGMTVTHVATDPTPQAIVSVLTSALG
jgi:uroporphyrinogen-III synthase